MTCKYNNFNEKHFGAAKNNKKKSNKNMVNENDNVKDDYSELIYISKENINNDANDNAKKEKKPRAKYVKKNNNQIKNEGNNVENNNGENNEGINTNTRGDYAVKLVFVSADLEEGNYT